VNWKPKSSPAALGKAPTLPAEVIDRETLAQWLVGTCKAFGAKLSTSYQVAGKVIEQIENDYEDGPAELQEPDCDYCYGEGGDPLNDYCLPCPKCGR
jgi:hypothetical protein